MAFYEKYILVYESGPSLISDGCDEINELEGKVNAH